MIKAPPSIRRASARVLLIDRSPHFGVCSLDLTGPGQTVYLACPDSGGWTRLYLMKMANSVNRMFNDGNLTNPPLDRTKNSHESLTRKADHALEEVVNQLIAMDSDGSRTARVFRSTFDQLYDGQRTGRYKWDQLFKTEKTHFGTLIEINLQREFVFEDGDLLDYKIMGHEVDSKFSATGQWMLPPESYGQLVLGSMASDIRSLWSLGLIRVDPENLRLSVNRDKKGGLSQSGRSRIRWIHRDAPLPPNTLLQLPAAAVERIMTQRSGQARVNELFRIATNRRISRNVVATVAQQDDFMKRVRENGGARSALRPEGYIILGGDYSVQRAVAQKLGCTVPEPGEMVSVRIGPVDYAASNGVELDGRYWVVQSSGDSIPAPLIPQR